MHTYMDVVKSTFYWRVIFHFKNSSYFSFLWWVIVDKFLKIETFLMKSITLKFFWANTCRCNYKRSSNFPFNMKQYKLNCARLIFNNIMSLIEFSVTSIHVYVFFFSFIFIVPFSFKHKKFSYSMNLTFFFHFQRFIASHA